jgi:hypothetical protein
MYTTKKEVDDQPHVVSDDLIQSVDQNYVKGGAS